MKGEAHAAAWDGAVVFERPDRIFRRVSGKAPAQMLSGLLSGSIPADPTAGSDAVLRGRAPCSAILTPKGKMISDARVLRLEAGDGGALLVELPTVALPGALAHFARYLPPRHARVEEAEPAVSMLSVIGPEAQRLLPEAVSCPALWADGLPLGDGDERTVTGASRTGVHVIRSSEAVPPSFDIVAETDELARIGARLSELGIPHGDAALRDVLRIERGTPAFGTDMDEDTIPLEAGLGDRCIDHRKGCYAGQEVIVRIRDRGHVNRQLRGMLLGSVDLPPRGTPLFAPAQDRAVGEITSSAFSARFGQGIALGYVRKEIEPPAELGLGESGGARVSVREISPGGWRLVPGDPSLHP